MSTLSHDNYCNHQRSLYQTLCKTNTIHKMSESQEATNTPMPSSADAVSVKMQEGFQEVAVRATVGLVLGGMAGVVLSRGGGSSMRKVLAGFGAGAGGGSAWTKCSISIDELVSSATK